MKTVADLLLARAEDDNPGLLFEDRVWTWREVVQASAERAHLLAELRPEGPFHVGLLLDNVPEFVFLLGAAALAGAAVVGINPTRRGAELERDIRFADCGILITEDKHRPLLQDIETGVGPERCFGVETVRWRESLAPHAGRSAPQIDFDPLAPFLLIFTSGTTGDPKAALCSQLRCASIGEMGGKIRDLTPRDVLYQAMPMFHSNALFAGWAPALAWGTGFAMRRRFSASGFLPDVRKFGATQANYVGKPLSYVLATPERPDDADNPLTLAFGNEGAVHDIERFERRFGCKVRESYGSTEGGVAISRDADTPLNALGKAGDVAILDPDTGEECPPARFDAAGKLANADEAVGEIVNLRSAPTFEGYWKNAEANTERTHDGIYWTGDLGYRDQRGYIYFAGRGFDWLRVDGENFAAAPLERILVRHPDVSLACVYAVPDAQVGDQVMAALILEAGARFEPGGFAEFLASQADLGTKWTPRYVRVSESLPSTETNKILKRVLRRQRWECDDPVWLRDSEGNFRPLTPEDAARIRSEFAARGRESALEG
ncbi:MAG: AMP-binding protein [Proteobacteria bacterium]|nr:AMP-binding protein [Pseudomonadota bacterium]